MKYQEYCDQFINAVNNLEVYYFEEKISLESGFIKWNDFTFSLKNNDKYLYFIGNGASSAIASHMAADFCKAGKLNSKCFNEPSLLTAIGNDISFKDIFSLPLSQYGRKGDMLVTVSSSGNSPNIICGIEMALNIGMTVITLSGKEKNNQCRHLGHLNFYLPHMEYGIVESAHQMILHYWLDEFVLNNHKSQPYFKNKARSKILET